MALDKNSIDTRPSTVKKNIFVSGCSTAGVYSVAHYDPKNIYIFVSIYVLLHGTWKKSIETLPTPKKKLFLITVLLRDFEKM